MLHALLFAALVCCTQAAALAGANSLPAKEVVAHVAAVKSDAVLSLSSIGDVVLADILYPNRESAQNWLAEYTLQKEFTFRATGEDRYGRTQMLSSLQVDLINDGAAVYFASERAIPKTWRVAEVAARNAQRGVWDERAQSVRISPTQASDALGEWRVVEGPITRIYEGRSATYLNFGENWQQDFSVKIPAKFRRSMKGLLGDLKAGDRVRMRGVVFEENGPMIELRHADNIEKL